MYELKKIGKVFTSKFVGTGPSSYKKRVYWAAVLQKLRNTALDHQSVQGTIDNNTEGEINEDSNTPGGLDTLKIQDTKQKCECENTSDTVDRKSPKRPRRQPVTRNSDFFMDKHQQILMRGDRNSRNKTVTTKPNLSILHQNIQSVGNKLIEVDLVLKSHLNDIDVLCFTEHWLKRTI